MTRARLVFTILAFTAVPLAAQSQRLTIRLSPTPNQTTRLRSAQDLVMTTDAEAAAGGVPALPAMTMNMHTEIESTSAVGPTDDRGYYSSQMTIDHVSMTMTMNGQPMPSAPALADVATRAVTISYDDQGKILDTSIAGGDAGVANETLKQIMARAFATVAPMTLSVGESVTIPGAMNLPIPGGAAGTLDVGAETRYTLTSVTFDGADRIAHLAVHNTSTMTHPAAAVGSRAMALDMTMTGDGTTDVNVDRGLILHMELHSTIETSMQAPAPAARSVRMHGAFTMVSDLVK
jgi:hypothetical protein